MPEESTLVTAEQTNDSASGANEGEQAAAVSGDGQEQATGDQAQTQGETDGAEASTDYTLELGDNARLVEADVSSITEFAKSNNLSAEQAQAVLYRMDSLIGSYVDNANEQWRQETLSWQDDVRKDEELGGENFKASVMNAQAALHRFGSPALKEALNETGFGNHPELVRLLSRIGKAMEEDAILRGGSQAASKTPEEILYPSHGKEKE